MLSALFQDLAANVSHDDQSRALSRIRSLLTIRFAAVFFYRLSQAVGARSPIVASMIKQLNTVVTGCDIAWQAKVGPGLVVFHPVGVVVGPRVTSGSNLIIQQGVTVGDRRASDLAAPKLGDDVYLGAGCRVLGAVTLGDGAKVGANAVVLDDVPAGARAVGVPAIVIEP